MIHICEDWYLDADKYQFILGQSNPDKTYGDKQSALIDMSYYPRLSQAATFLLNKLQRELIFDRQIKAVEDFVAEQLNAR